MFSCSLRRMEKSGVERKLKLEELGRNWTTPIFQKADWQNTTASKSDCTYDAVLHCCPIKCVISSPVHPAGDALAVAV